MAVPAFAEEAPAPAVTPANAAAPPSAADLLFEQPQMRNAAPGSTITYDYLRRSGIAKGPFGAPLQDTVTLKVEKPTVAEKGGAGTPSADARDIAVTMFSGLNRVPAGPFEDMTGNPIVSLFFENHLRALAKVLEANPRYLKLAIRRGLRERAAVTPVKVKVGDREVDGWQVVTRPFAGDPMTERMRGLDDLTYTVVTSPAVPGEIVSMEAASRSKDGGELLQEKLNYDPKAG
ncbi:hypothetical protein [Methylobacterium amylolyticum]|uniref:hypothetical protein n=1 Tax=Methylobacterium sp. NEAU 140 TaxID=3064945 RepID=UPI00351F82E3